MSRTSAAPECAATDIFIPATQRIAQLGWHEGLRQTGALLLFTFRDVHIFEVAGTFPRLPDDYLPPLGVTGIKYNINVGSLPSLDVSEVPEVLQTA